MDAPVIAVFGASTSHPGDGHYEEAMRCGQLLGEAGFAVVTGGYGGVMEAASAGARCAGVPVIGVTAPTVFPERSGANAHVTEVRPAPSLTERIHQILDLAAASIALHGSIGTLTELVMAWNVAHVAGVCGTPVKPIVAVGPRWRRIIEHLGSEVGADTSAVVCVPNVGDAVTEVSRRVRS